MADVPLEVPAIVDSEKSMTCRGIASTRPRTGISDALQLMRVEAFELSARRRPATARYRLAQGVPCPTVSPRQLTDLHRWWLDCGPNRSSSAPRKKDSQKVQFPLLSRTPLSSRQAHHLRPTTPRTHHIIPNTNLCGHVDQRRVFPHSRMGHRQARSPRACPQ